MELPPTDKLAEAARQPLWQKVITATPVIMAVLSTLLAGLSSSEMSFAQYYRSIASQDQSKATDQWGFFQAKKIRGGISGTAAEMLVDQGNADATFSPATLSGIANAPAFLAEMLADPKTRQALKLLSDEPLPPIGTSFIADDQLQKAYNALSNGDEKSLDPNIFERITEPTVRDAIRRGEEQAQNISDTFNGPLKILTKLKSALTKMALSSDPQCRRVLATFAAAQQRFDAARQAREAQANQVTAYLYEIEVRRASVQSDRHRIRSKYFFYGMLGTQAAVTIATIAIAAREKNTLWTLAAGIGAIAVMYAGYVYLFT
jgi:hypothetical protein